MNKIIRYAASALLLAFTLPMPAQHSYTLEECRKMAIENNRNLSNSRLDIEAAAEDRKVALTKYFPQISASGTGFIAAHSLISTDIEIAAMGMSLPFNMIKHGTMASVTAMQPVFYGGQIVNGNKLAALQQEVRRLQYSMTERDLLQEVTEYYWQLVSLKGTVATLDAVKEQLDEVERLTSNYVKAGVAQRNDLLTVQLKQQEVASQRLKVENGQKLVSMVLAQLIGANGEEMLISDSAVTNPPLPATYFVAPDEAVAMRAELQLADKAVEASRLQQKIEVGKRLPSLAVGAMAYSMKYDKASSQQNAIGLATLSIPLSDWWGGSHSIKKTKIARLKAENDRQEAQEKLRIDIASAWNNLLEAYSQIEIARASVSQAEENLRLNQEQYKAGTQTLGNLLDAVTLFTQSHNSLQSASATYQTRVADYQSKTH